MVNVGNSCSVITEACTAALMSLLHKGKKPEPWERRNMVRILVDHAIKKRAPKGKKTFDSLAQRMAEMFPSLIDSISGERVGAGYESLSKQLVNRAENIRRDDTQQKKRAISFGDSGPTPKRLRLTDQ